MKPSSPASSPRTERGATAAEYALLVSLIALAVIGSVAAMGNGVHGLYQNTCTKYASATATGPC